jgi:hypothetical protein
MGIYTLLFILWFGVIPLLCLCIFLIAQRMHRQALPMTLWNGPLEVYVYGKGRVPVNMLFTETLTAYIIVAFAELDLPYEAGLSTSDPVPWKITWYDRQRAKLIVHLT